MGRFRPCTCPPPGGVPPLHSRGEGSGGEAHNVERSPRVRFVSTRTHEALRSRVRLNTKRPTGPSQALVVSADDSRCPVGLPPASATDAHSCNEPAPCAPYQE